MSSRALFLFVCAVLGAAPVAAQDARRQDEEILRLQHSGDSLLTLWRDARALADLQDSLKHAASVGRLDTLQVHSIRIISNPSDLPLREAAERYWPSLDSLYGDAAAQLASRPILIQVRPDSSESMQPWNYWGMPVKASTKVDDLVNILKSVINLGQGDSALSVWTAGTVVPPLFGMEQEATDAYVTLVSTSMDIGRRCFQGEMPACVAALRLNDSDPAVLLAAFPDLAERQLIVSRLESFFRQRRNLDGLAACRAGSDSACSMLIQSVPPSLIAPPLERETRQLLLHIALAKGGRQAYQRLLSNPEAPMGERIAAAAGVPIDSLLVEWRQTVIAHRPAPVSLPLSGVLAGLVWIVVLGYFGTRSSRWRLG